MNLINKSKLEYRSRSLSLKLEQGSRVVHFTVFAHITYYDWGEPAVSDTNEPVEFEK